LAKTIDGVPPTTERPLRPWATQTLSGGEIAGKDTNVWSHLAIARHRVLPSNWVFSTGWWEDEVGDTGQFCIDLTGGNPAPSDLTPDNGTVVYLLRKLLNARDVTDGNLCDTVIRAIVAVQVNADETLAVEPLPGIESAEIFSGFSAEMWTCRR